MGIVVVWIVVVVGWVRVRGWLAGGGSSDRDQDNGRGRVMMMVVMGGTGRVVMMVVVWGPGRPSFDSVVMVVLKMHKDMLSGGRRGRRGRRGRKRFGRRRWRARSGGRWSRVDVHVVVLVGDRRGRRPHLELGHKKFPKEFV